jgi:hypothetical protein
MNKLVLVILAAIALAACGGAKAATPTAPAPTPTTAATATPPTTAAAAPTTTAPAPTTTAAPTTTIPPTTTTADPFDAALRAAGFTPKADTKATVQEYCDAFDRNDAKWMASVANETQNAKNLLKAGFGVLCPANVPFIGTTPPPKMPSGDPVFSGYPKIVNVSTIDSRVRSWYQGKLVDNQVVALAPGIYAPYNPNVPDLNEYLSGPVDGDCAAKQHYFPEASGACWSGVK